MALRIEKFSPNVWGLYSDNTLLVTVSDTTITIGSGATLKAGAVPIALPSGLQNYVGAAVNGYRIARGVATTASATDTIATGLTTVAAVVVSFQTDPADANLLVSATIGNQSDAPVAGSFILNTWKTDGTDPTPVAATSFSKAVNWIAIGT